MSKQYRQSIGNYLNREPHNFIPTVSEDQLKSVMTDSEIKELNKPAQKSARIFYMADYR